VLFHAEDAFGVLAAAAEAISHWRYKPAACGQTPIRMETSIP
jgi:hypothetical protein